MHRVLAHILVPVTLCLCNYVSKFANSGDRKYEAIKYVI